MILINVTTISIAHMNNTALIAELVAEQMGFTRRQVKIIRSAALYHDVGKSYIVPEILNKKTKLSEQEFSEVKKHTLYGYAVLARNGMYYEALAALLHHERTDGSGYPLGLIGDLIPPYVKIVSVSDVFSALIEPRPYRAPLSLDEATEIISDTKKYDENVLKALMKVISEYYELIKEVCVTSIRSNCG